MTEIKLVMNFGGLACDKGAETGIPDAQHSPELPFAFHSRIRHPRERTLKIAILQLSRSVLGEITVLIPCLTQNN
jgi:hypothetical protein